MPTLTIEKAKPFVIIAAVFITAMALSHIQSAVTKMPLQAAALSVQPDLDIEIPATKEVQAPVLSDLSHDGFGGDTPTLVQAESCEPTMTLKVMAAASVGVDIQANCHIGEVVRIGHQGLQATYVVPKHGKLSVVMPALFETALIMAAFEDGSQMLDLVEVPMIDLYERVAVQWQGVNDVDLHVFENDSDFGNAGHVWQENPKSSVEMTAGTTGFWQQLGDPTAKNAQIVQVYTMLATSNSQIESTNVSLDIGVEHGTCGQVFKVDSLQKSPRSRPAVTEISVTMPNCDAIGEILVLNDIFRPLKVAGNYGG